MSSVSVCFGMGADCVACRASFRAQVENVVWFSAWRAWLWARSGCSFEHAVGAALDVAAKRAHQEGSITQESTPQESGPARVHKNTLARDYSECRTLTKREAAPVVLLHPSRHLLLAGQLHGARQRARDQLGLQLKLREGHDVEGEADER